MRIPKEWVPKFYVYFWDKDQEPIELNLEEAKLVKTSMMAGAKYIEIGEGLISVSGIKMVKPVHNWDGVPPKPKPIVEKINGKPTQVENPLLKEWYKRYQKNALEGGKHQRGEGR